jgi:flagellar hook-length control protein FliK
MVTVLPFFVKPADTVKAAEKTQKAEEAFSGRVESSLKKHEGEETFLAQLERFLGQVDREKVTEKKGETASAVRQTPRKHLSGKNTAHRFTAANSSKKAISALGRTLNDRAVSKGQEKIANGRAQIKTEAGGKSWTLFALLRNGQDRSRFKVVFRHRDASGRAQSPGRRTLMAENRISKNGSKKIGIEKKGKQDLRAVKRMRWMTGSGSRGVSKLLLEKNSRAAEERGTAEESARPKPWQSGKEHSFACDRYESNIHRAETVQNARAQGQAGKTADEIFGEIVRQFTFTVKKGGGEARIVLQPRSLGELRLSIKLHNAEVNTSMIVETAALRDLIVSKLSTLQESLLKQGFSLGSFNVEVKERGASNDMGGNNQGGQGKSADTSLVAQSVLGETGAGGQSHFQGLPWISTVVNIVV